MVDTYKCFGCGNEFDIPPASMLIGGTEPIGNFDICHRCTDKLLMRKGSL